MYKNLTQIALQMRLNFIAILKYFLIIPFLLASLYFVYVVKKIRAQKRRAVIEQQISKQFPFKHGIDTSGNSTVLNLQQTPITIIDFWFKNCPACIAEMKQFERLLKGKEESVSIISMSIDKFDVWKKAFNPAEKRFEFLSRSIPNWKHLMVAADSNGVTVNKSGGQLVAEKLGVNSYPSFFVLDKLGNIIATPESAAAYLDTNHFNQNGFYIFLTNKATWRSIYILLLVAFLLLVYPFIFKQAIKWVLQLLASPKSQ